MPEEPRELTGKIAPILEENRVLTLATGEGDGLWAATMYFLRDGLNLCCVVKPGAKTIENILDSPRFAVTIDGQEPGTTLQAVGRAVIAGPIDEEPSIREAFLARHPQMARFIETTPGCLLIRLIVERYHVTEHISGPAPRWEYVTEEAAARLPFAALWGRAVRAFSFTASLIPPAVGAMLAFLHEAPAMWTLTPLVLVASVSYHAGTNLVNDYYDFKNNVDRKGTLGSSGLLVNGLISAKSVLRGSIVFFAVGTLIGFYFISIRGLPILVLGLVGLLGGFFYTGGPISYKYKAIGEPMVFMLMGPLMVVGSYIVLTGSFRWDVVLVSLPVGCLVAAILQSNDLRDIQYDSRVGIKTAAIVFGRKVAGIVYYALVISAYVIVAILAAVEILPLWSLAVLVTLPAAVKNMNTVRKIVAGGYREYATIDVQTAQLHMAFGVMLILSLAAGRLL